MAIPKNPTNLKAVYDQAGDKVILTMNIPVSSPATTSVRIQRWVSTTKLYTDLKTVPVAQASRVEDAALTDGLSYAYRALAINADGTQRFFSLASNTVKIVASPDSPASVKSERQGTSGISNTWTNRTSALKPVDTNYIFRWDNVTNKQTQINKLPGNATYYLDTRAPDDRSLRYRIWAANVAGGAYYMSPFGGICYTKPASPQSFRVTWMQNTDLVLRWINPSTIAAGFHIDHSIDNVNWFPMARLGKVTSWVHRSPERGVPHYYRIRAFSPKPTVGDAVMGDYVYRSIPAQTTPNPPDIIGPAFAAAGSSFQLQIVHNPLDGSAMGAAQIRHRQKGSSTWSATVAGLTVPAYSSGTVEVQAATRGTDTDFGLWSNIAAVSIKPRPTLTLNSPAASSVIPGPLLPIGWTASRQAAYEVELKQGTEVIDTWTGTSDRTVYASVEDGTTYTVRIRISDGDLWSDWVTRTITTAFETVGGPTLTLTLDPENLNIVAHATTVSGSARTEILRRRSIDGDWVSLGNIDSDGYRLDPRPPLGVPLEYVAVAWTANNAAGLSNAHETILDRFVAAVNYGPSMGSVVYVEANVESLDVEQSRTRALHQFAGRRLPVEVLGVAQNLSVGVSGVLLDQLGSSPEQWQEMLSTDGPKWFRDPTGNSFLCSIENISLGKKYNRSEVSFKADQVEAV